jgi:flagellar basal body-associated protein FliL
MQIVRQKKRHKQKNESKLSIFILISVLIPVLVSARVLILAFHHRHLFSCMYYLLLLVHLFIPHPRNNGDFCVCEQPEDHVLRGWWFILKIKQPQKEKKKRRRKKKKKKGETIEEEKKEGKGRKRE